jgi:uncharacterized membrane protein
MAMMEVAPKRELDAQPRRFAILYLLLAIPAALLLNLSYISFHAPDDPDHAKRAYTLLHNPFHILTPPNQSSGMMIDSGMLRYIDGQPPAILNKLRDTEEYREAFKANAKVRWTKERKFSPMPGAASYFPLLYAPQALMLQVGLWADFTVARSVLLARIANSLAGILLAALALRLLRAGHAIALVTLLLPRTLFQYASNSADAVLYGLALLIIALGLRSGQQGRSPAPATIFTSLCIFVATAVRPTIAALALLPAGHAAVRRRWGAAVLLSVSTFAAACWFLTVYPLVVDLRCGELGSMTSKLYSFALRWPSLIGRTVLLYAPQYVSSFIGHYGRGEGPAGQFYPMPSWILLTSVSLFGWAVWLDVKAKVALSPLSRIFLITASSGVVLLIFLAMYVGCTSPRDTAIFGVQGRYFVPAVFALAPAMSGVMPTRTKFPTWFAATAAVWVAVCVLEMVMAVPELYGDI